MAPNRACSQSCYLIHLHGDQQIPKETESIEIRSPRYVGSRGKHLDCLVRFRADLRFGDSSRPRGDKSSLLLQADFSLISEFNSLSNLHANFDRESSPALNSLASYEEEIWQAA